MHDHTREVLGGAEKTQDIVDKQRKVKDGRLVKKKSPAVGQVVKSQGPHVKKSVNGYIIFRTAMQHVFSDYTQGERSPFIREMWEKEIHKPTWSLIGKVFTHIRDFSGGFKSTLQYAVAAIEETRLTQPDRWLNTYNMVLVIDNAGVITLRQHSPPTSIPEPRQLTDVELLFRVLKRGLPVKNPVELLDSLVRSQKHHMTVSDPAMPSGKADPNLIDQIDNDPLVGLSYVGGLTPANSFFERGVSNLEALGSIRVDDALLTSPGDYTFGGLDFDDSTAHLTILNNDALNANTMTGASQTFEMGVPPQWDSFSGQISQHNYQIANNTVPGPTPDYPENVDFMDLEPSWNLQ
uniref:Mating type gene n=6 Tax=Diaporthaceae TaxID=767018 RepID=Q1MX53_9PEZI|nr:mating type gene [Diaporthe sp. P-Pt-19]